MNNPNCEYWKVIEGYNYFVSTYGRIENGSTGRILKPGINNHGYYYVNLCKNGKYKSFKTHRLVAEAFIENPDDKVCIDHINNDKLNNNVTNLRWATHSENCRNSSKRSNNTSGTTGVYFHKQNNKWMAYIMINGKNKTIGYFKTKEEAIQARKEYVNDYFGDFVHISQKL